MRLLSLVVILVALVACVRYQPKPLAPGQSAEELESRSLKDPALGVFVSANLHRPFTNAPPVNWDFEMLTLAAFYYHPSLEVARADWRVAQGGERTASERPNPTVTASAAYEPASDAFSPWIPGLIFDLPIETAGKRRLRTEQARHLSEAARLNVAAAAWQVRAGVRTSLLELTSAQLRVELLQHQFALHQEFAERLENQFQAGAIAASERNVARLSVVRARADLAEGRRILAEARPHLASALGMALTGLEDGQFQFDLTATPGVDDLTSRTAREAALRGRSDVLSALSDYAATQSALQLEVARQYPDIRLAPGYSWNAGSTGEHDWQIGATVELPVLNRHQGPIAEAAARRDASAARFLALQAKVISQVDAALASFRANQTNVVALNSLVASQTTQRQLIEQQFQAGAVDRLEVVTADLQLNAAQLAHLDSQVKLQQALAALEDAIQRPFPLPPAVFESEPTKRSR